MAGSSDSKTASNSPKKSLSAGVKGYLFLYNGVQVAGWSYVMYLTISHYLSGGSTSNLWSVVGTSLMYFQNAALIEILNVSLGYVRSPFFITFIQVLSRVMVVCCLLWATPTAQVSIGLPIVIFAWSITEIVRYSFYALNLFNVIPYFLVWSRYTFFYFLYPIGITGELLLYYATQSYVSETNLWTWEMPNTLNFTFNYRYILIGIMLFYIPQFPQMYMHMVNQRKKVIGGQNSSSVPSSSKKTK